MKRYCRSGTGAEMSWDQRGQCLQIHTADQPAPIPSQIGLPGEPMTCPQDAFNSGTDLIRLNPRESHVASCSMYAL